MYVATNNAVKALFDPYSLLDLPINTWLDGQIIVKVNESFRHNKGFYQLKKKIQIRFFSENFIKVFMTFFLWSQIMKIYLLFLLLRRSHFLLANHAIY